ncbi:MAG: Uma2 family endonuclease, partial [Cyanobacteria bacterium P01_F01_bin.42]
LAPDWIIEILSPNQSATHVTEKILHAIQHGSQMGWLIDPNEQLILVYAPDQTPAIAAPTEQIPTPEFTKAIALTPQQIFGWLTLHQ